MKRQLLMVLVAMSAAGSWGEVVHNLVQSANMFGSLQITGVMSNAFVAVPFVDFDGTGRKAQDVVSPAGLSNGDKLYVWDAASDKYDVFKVENGAWTAQQKVTIDVNGTASTDNPDLTRAVAAGTGVLLQRTNPDNAIYVFGQIPPDGEPKARALPAGLSLLSAPGTNALAAVDLNALTWTGVTDSTASVRGTSGTRRGLLRTTGDSIYYRNAENVVVMMHHFDGRWGRFMNGYWIPEATIPAGTAFWYYNRGSATVTW